MKSNYFKRFRKTNSFQRRSQYVAAWVAETMERIPVVKIGDTTDSLVRYLVKHDKASNGFCGRDLMDGWALHEHWFRNLLAASPKTPKIKNLFTLLNWDFEFYRNPFYTDTTSLVDCGVPGREVMILVKSTGHFPEGSRWRNKRSGKIWKILYFDDLSNRYQLELQSSNFEVHYGMVQRDGQAITKNFIRIGV